MLSSPTRDLLLVADSGPLIGLAGVAQLGLLPRLYRRIGAPPAVVQEVLAARDPRRGRAVLEQAPWLERLPVPERLDALSVVLGRGETEAIAVARGEADSLLLLDDHTARRAAAVLELPVVGSAGVLVRAKREGLIVSVHPILLRMRDNGYFLSDRLIERACAEAGERLE